MWSVELGSFAALAPIEIVLIIMRSAGFSPEQAVHALRSLVAYVIGTLLREVSSGPTFSGENLGGVDDRLSELRGSELPHWSRPPHTLPSATTSRSSTTAST